MEFKILSFNNTCSTLVGIKQFFTTNRNFKIVIGRLDYILESRFLLNMTIILTLLSFNFELGQPACQ